MAENSLNILHNRNTIFIVIAQIKRYICLPDCDVFSQSEVSSKYKPNYLQK